MNEPKTGRAVSGAGETAGNGPHVMVGIPAFNEERYIGSVILQAKKYADEIFVVDDGSADRTVRIATLAGADVMRHEANQGYGASIRRILARAKENGAEKLVILDGDGQHDPDDIPALLAVLDEGNDVVIGSRVKTGSEIPLYRRMGQKVLSSLTNIASKANVTDTESGFRAYSRKAIETLELKEEGMAVSAEIVTAAAAEDLRLAEAPISVSYEGDTSTINPVKHGMSNVNRILVMISERRPMLFFGTGGAILLLVGLAEAINVIRLYYFGDNVFAVGPSLLAILFFTTGILTVFTGVILNVISKRISELKR